MLRRTLFLLCAAALAAAGARGAGVVRAAGGASTVPGRRATPAAPSSTAILTAIGSRLDGRTGVVTIEASDPVPYVASQPDPRTFVVELRDIDSTGVADRIATDPRHPVEGVTVEHTTAADGARLTRVRLRVAQASHPRARSVRNMIYVEADRFASAAIVEPRAAVAQTAAPITVPIVAPIVGQATGQATIAAPVAALPTVPAPAAMSLTQCSDMKQYTGHAVSLDFQNADLRAVLRAFAEISGLNIVIDPDITQGSVDVALRDVPWDQALSVILRANKLDCLVEGGILRVASNKTLTDESKQRTEDKDRRNREINEAGSVPLTYALSYAKAEEVVALLKSSRMVSKDAEPTFDPRTNTLIIKDTPERLADIKGLIKTLDQPQPQVEIEARIVQTTRTFARALGVQWGIGARASQALGNTLPLAFPNSASITGRTGVSQGEPAPAPQTNATSSVVNLATQAASSAIGLALGSINGALNLDVALSALESQGQGRVLSTPRVSTQNNVEAEITQGVQVPIQTVANNTVTVTFKDAALTLKVTPQITAANTVIMRIAVENASPDYSRSVNNIPPIDTQRALTQVLVSDGETTVIGGIYISSEQSDKDRTPGLNRLPLLGWLFKREKLTDESRELIIFITPRIVRM